MIYPSHLRDDLEQEAALARWQWESRFDESRTKTTKDQFLAIRGRLAKLDYLRKQYSTRSMRGGKGARHFSLVSEPQAPPNQRAPEVRLHRALDRLKALNKRQYDCVIGYYFEDLTLRETGVALGISEALTSGELKAARETLSRLMKLIPEMPRFARLPEHYYAPPLTLAQIDHIERMKWHQRTLDDAKRKRKT